MMANAPRGRQSQALYTFIEIFGLLAPLQPSTPSEQVQSEWPSTHHLGKCHRARAADSESIAPKMCALCFASIYKHEQYYEKLICFHSDENKIVFHNSEKCYRLDEQSTCNDLWAPCT